MSWESDPRSVEGAIAVVIEGGEAQVVQVSPGLTAVVQIRLE